MHGLGAHAQRGGTHRELFEHATRFHEQRLQIILCDLHTGTRGTGHLSLCIFAADSSGNGIQKLLRTSDSAASIQDSCARVASMICCAVLVSPELSPADPASWAFIPGISVKRIHREIGKRESV